MVIMDHKNLGYFKQPWNLTHWQAQWMLFLQKFDLIWGVEQGINMGPADTLSQKDKVDISDDNQEITLLKGDSQYHHIWAIDTALTKKIISSSSSDSIVTTALTAMNDEEGEPWIPHISKDNWKYEDGGLYFKHWLYIPEQAHHDLVSSLHQSPAGGYEGFFRTLHQMQKDYWWPGMSTFLWKFISGCADCQAAKVNTHPMIPGWSPLTVKYPLPFSISVNLITRLPNFHGFDSVMVVVDHGLMKGVIYCPCTKTLTQLELPNSFSPMFFPDLAYTPRWSPIRDHSSPLHSLKNSPVFSNTTLLSLLPIICRPTEKPSK